MEKRNHRLQIPVTRKELEKVNALAKEADMTTATYCRYILLKHKLEITIE